MKGSVASATGPFFISGIGTVSTLGKDGLCGVCCSATRTRGADLANHELPELVACFLDPVLESGGHSENDREEDDIFYNRLTASIPELFHYSILG
jgi:hypothetical protein